MKKEFTPIAMRCTKEQFEAIKPKLENFYKEINGFGKFSYLTNFLFGRGNNIGNIFESCKGDYNREIHDTWNEKVFLEACGIETEQEYTITKERIIDLTNAHDINDITRLCKEWFPEVFETVFKNGYYKHKEDQYPRWFWYINFETLENYGANSLGEWCVQGKNMDSYVKENCEPMTESEVFEALKNEAVKRYKNDDYLKCLVNDFISDADIVYLKDLDKSFRSKNELWLPVNEGKQSACVFKDGQWAEIIPTITRKEAENKLGVKIVD